MEYFTIEQADYRRDTRILFVRLGIEWAFETELERIVNV